MGFQFAETMAGTIEWDAHPGVKHPFSFEVTAEAASTRGYLHDGKAVLHGVVHAPPLVSVGYARGTITIRPVVERIIRYELQFGGDDGRTYELVGQKDIQWLAPLRSFTFLPAEILDDEHRRIATCQAAFDLRRDWWSFLRSFRPLRPTTIDRFFVRVARARARNKDGNLPGRRSPTGDPLRPHRFDR